MKKIRIYQLNSENEVARNLMFMSYKWAKKHLSLSLYKMVWEGEVDDESTLDDIYHQFNVNRPADFKGHSLSISDLVEENGEYYYCDSYGWEEVTELFPMPDLKKGEKYYCIKDYVMDDGSIAYKEGNTYEMLSDIHLGIDEGGSELHKMSEERDFFIYFDLVL